MNDIEQYLPIETIKEFRNLVGKTTFDLMTTGNGYNTCKLLNFNASTDPEKYYRCKNIITEYLHKKGKIQKEDFNLADYYTDTYQKIFKSNKNNLPIPYFFQNDKLTWKITFILFEHLCAELCHTSDISQLMNLKSIISPDFLRREFVNVMKKNNFMKYHELDIYEQSIIDSLINKIDFDYMYKQFLLAIQKILSKC